MFTWVWYRLLNRILTVYYFIKSRKTALYFSWCVSYIEVKDGFRVIHYNSVVCQFYFVFKWYIIKCVWQFLCYCSTVNWHWLLSFISHSLQNLINSQSILAETQTSITSVGKFLHAALLSFAWCTIRVL